MCAPRQPPRRPVATGGSPFRHPKDPTVEPDDIDRFRRHADAGHRHPGVRLVCERREPAGMRSAAAADRGRARRQHRHGRHGRDGVRAGLRRAADRGRAAGGRARQAQDGGAGLAVGWRCDADLRRHAEPRPAGGDALPRGRRSRGRHPRGDCLDRRRRALRAPPAGPGALHLGPDPGHRLRPGCRRPAGRPDRLAPDPGGAWHRACRGRRASIPGDAPPRQRRTARARSAGLSPQRRRGACWRIAGCASSSAPRSSRAPRCSARLPTSAPSCTSASASASA